MQAEDSSSLWGSGPLLRALSVYLDASTRVSSEFPLLFSFHAQLQQFQHYQGPLPGPYTPPGPWLGGTVENEGQTTLFEETGILR